MKTLCQKNLTRISSLLLVMMALVATSFSASAAVDSMNASTNTTAGAKDVTVNLTAKDFAFNASTITVPAGANVTINFDNMDAGIPHNVAVYENRDAQKAIFVGDVINGPETIAYNFMAPAEAGTYFFRCDVHPRTMIGDFLVQ